jgi:hypothetical protein
MRAAAAVAVMLAACGGSAPPAGRGAEPPALDAAPARLTPVDVTRRLLALRGVPDAKGMDEYIRPLGAVVPRFRPLHAVLRALRCAEPHLVEEPGAGLFDGKVPALPHHVVVEASCRNDDSFHDRGTIVEPSRTVVWVLYDDDPSSTSALVVTWHAATRN